MDDWKKAEATKTAEDIASRITMSMAIMTALSGALKGEGHQLSGEKYLAYWREFVVREILVDEVRKGRL